MAQVALSALLSLTLPGCGSGQTDARMESIPIAGIGQSNCPAQMKFLGSPAEWAAFWKPCDLKPPPPAALTQYGVVAICLGQRPGGGAAITARAWVEDRKTPVVSFTLPPPGGGPLTVMESRCDVFEVPRSLATADWRNVRFGDSSKKREEKKP